MFGIGYAFFIVTLLRSLSTHTLNVASFFLTVTYGADHSNLDGRMPADVLELAGPYA